MPLPGHGDLCWPCKRTPLCCPQSQGQGDQPPPLTPTHCQSRDSECWVFRAACSR